MRVFLDTNILLDVLTGREPFYAESVRVWTIAENARSGYIAAITVANLYYIARKQRSHAAAVQMVRSLRRTFTTVRCDEALLDEALDLDLSDLEDGIQYASAIAAKADWLVTRNAGDFPDKGLPVVTPAAFLAAIETP